MPGETYSTTLRFRDSEFQSLGETRGNKVATIEGNKYYSEKYRNCDKIGFKMCMSYSHLKPSMSQLLPEQCTPHLRPCALPHHRENGFQPTPMCPMQDKNLAGNPDKNLAGNPESLLPCHSPHGIYLQVL